MKPIWINKNEKVAAFDCDDTLAMWDDKFNEPGEGKIPFLDPYSKAGYGGGPVYIYLTPHQLHIRKLKGYHKSGWFVIIWSAGGSAWAKSVADTLELTNHCSLITAKPSVLYDDQPYDNMFSQGARRYFQPKKVKKDEPK